MLRLTLAAMTAAALYGCAPDPVQCRAEGVMLPTASRGEYELDLNVVCRTTSSEAFAYDRVSVSVHTLSNYPVATGFMRPLRADGRGNQCPVAEGSRRYGWSESFIDEATAARRLTARITLYGALGESETITVPLTVRGATMRTLFRCEYDPQ